MTEQVVAEDWVTRLADEVVAEAERRGSEVRSSAPPGSAPSGPIHLGNFRELITPHLVADEIKRRGIPCEHILSWDDFDRFRRVPKNLAGVDESWDEHIGKPLTSVPAPHGSRHANWAEHFKAPLLEAMEATGIEVRQISQTEQYRAGAYREQILHAMRERADRQGARPVPTLEASRRGRRRREGQAPAGEQQKPTEERAAAATEAERGPVRRPRTTAARVGRLLPVQALLLGLRHGLHDRHRLRRRDHELTYECTRAATPRRSSWTSSPTASWSGRSTGRCGGPTSGCSSSRPASTTRARAPASSSARTSRRSSAGSGRSARCTRSSASPGWRR